MSKVLIDSKVLQDVMKALDFGADRLSMNYTDDYSELVYAKRHLESAIKNYDSKRFSVLEWHPMSEKPKDESDILVREKDGCIFDTHAFDSVDDGDWEIVRGNKNQIVEWAYPPEE